MNIQDDFIPFRRPHFHLRGGQLFFMISKGSCATFDPADCALWDKIDGVATVAGLVALFHDARERLRKFWDLSVIELVQSSFPADRRKVLVIEPHMDDAILSIGGLMWTQRNVCEFTVISVVGRSNFTSYHRINRDYFDVDIVSTLRCKESELVMRVLGGVHLALDRFDAPLRYQSGAWSLDWFSKNRRSISAFVNHSSSDSDVRTVVGAIEHVIKTSDCSEIWIPMGVGTSADHETTRDACLQALMNQGALIGDRKIYFYQDVPYAINFPRHAAQILSVLRSDGAVIERVHADISAVLDVKQRLISIFASQFKMSYMAPKVEASARLLGEAGAILGEGVYRVIALPGKLRRRDLYSGAEHVRSIGTQLMSWFPRNQHARKITILCPMGVGCWREDVETLLRSFASAEIEIHMTEDATDETFRFISPRISVIPVKGLAWAWIRRILAVVFSGSRPVVFLTGNRYSHLGCLLQKACIWTDPLVATTLDHLSQAIDRKGTGADTLV